MMTDTFKKGDKVKVSPVIWSNHWFEKCKIVEKNKDGTYDVISQDGFCEMTNVEPKYLKAIS